MNSDGAGNNAADWRRMARSVLALPYLAFAFWSCAMAAFGMIGMVQTFFYAIPEGRIVRIEPGRKGGPLLWLDNGEKAKFPDVFRGSRKPVTQTPRIKGDRLELVPGDTIAKSRYGFVYRLNGVPLTDMRSEFGFSFLDDPKPVFFALFVVSALAYGCVARGVGPLSVLNAWKQRDSKLASEDARAAGLASVLKDGLLRPLGWWLLCVLAVFALMEVMAYLLFAIAWAIKASL